MVESRLPFIERDLGEIKNREDEYLDGVEDFLDQYQEQLGVKMLMS